jgi:hypothetical protein
VHCHGAEHGTIRSVPVILFLAAAAILGCVVLAALGMGGEMAAFPTDSAPLRMDEVTAADVALLRPPLALWGYSVPATEEALGMIARAVTVRDTEIAALRQELAGMQVQRQPREHPAYDETPAHEEVPAAPAYDETPAHDEVPAGPAYDETPATPAHDEVPAWPAAPEPGSGD